MYNKSDSQLKTKFSSEYLKMEKLKRFFFHARELQYIIIAKYLYLLFDTDWLPLEQVTKNLKKHIIYKQEADKKLCVPSGYLYSDIHETVENIIAGWSLET